MATIAGGRARGLGAWAAPGLRLGSLLLLAAAPAGCGAELSEDALHEALAGWFRGEGIEVDGVRCPQALARERDSTVECRVMIGPEEVEVTVTMADDDGALSIRPRHATVVAARAEPEIEATLRAQGYAVAEVRCEGGGVWVARRGAEQRCEVVDDEGRRYAWIGVWSGEGTRQRTRVVPLPAGAGAGGMP